MQLYIVLALLAFMIISFVIHKIPFGVTAMICCVMLVVTGFYTPVEAFSGFSNQNIILLAPMFALSAAFGKTSLLKKIQNQMTILKGKRGYLLLAAMFAFLAVLAAFIPTTAMMTIAHHHHHPCTERPQRLVRSASRRPGLHRLCPEQRPV